MDCNSEERVKKLELKLNELKAQRIRVDEANEILRKKLETLTSRLNNIEEKYDNSELSSTATSEVKEIAKEE